MEISFDPAKNEKNIHERGLSFERAVEFYFQGAIFLVDSRYNYEEIRYIAVGYFERRLHILCFTETPTGIRVISFRKANAREAKKYEKSKIID